MAARIALGRVQERPLEMIARHHERAEPAAGDRRVEGPEAGRQRRRIGGDQGREAEGHAGRDHRLEGVIEGVGGQPVIVEVDPGKAVDLQIEEPARDHDRHPCTAPATVSGDRSEAAGGSRKIVQRACVWRMEAG